MQAGQVAMHARLERLEKELALERESYRKITESHAAAALANSARIVSFSYNTDPGQISIPVSYTQPTVVATTPPTAKATGSQSTKGRREL